MNKSALRLIAASGPWLAPVPSAWFIGRAIYSHLLDGWGGSVPIPPALNLGVAVVSGAVVEILAIVSVHNALALKRWNAQGRVKKEKGGWERAPMGQALACAGLYILTAFLLLVVLEAWPDLARFAPILFPFLAVVGALNLAILDQHYARLERYGLEWDLSKRYQALSSEKKRKRAETASASSAPRAAPQAVGSAPPKALTCAKCGKPYEVSAYPSAYHAEQAVRGHMAHCNGGSDD